MKKIGILTLGAAVAVSGLSVFGGGVADEAVAGVVATCNAGTVTLTKVDGETSTALPGASFRITSAGNVYIAEGTELTGEAFKEAFESKWTTSIPAEIKEAYASTVVVAADGAESDSKNTTTGRDNDLTVPEIPVDITALLENADIALAAKLEAITNWQADPKISGLSEFVDGRVTALTEAKTYADENGLAAVNPDAYGNLDAALAKATELKNNVDALKVAVTDESGVTAFVTAYDYVLTETNWTDGEVSALGMTKAVSQKWLDYIAYGAGAEVTDGAVEAVDGVSAQFNAANTGAATDNSLGQSITVTSDTDGKVEFKVFGVATDYANDDTRGSAESDCSHLTGVAIETIAPDGYILSSTPVNWVIDTNGTYTQEIPNTPWDAPEIETPPMQNNGGI